MDVVYKIPRDGTGDGIKPIDLRLSFLKPQGFKWLVEACSHTEKINCIQNGFCEAGITEALVNLQSQILRNCQLFLTNFMQARDIPGGGGANESKSLHLKWSVIYFRVFFEFIHPHLW